MRLNMVLLDHTMNWVTVVVGRGGSRSEVLTVCVCYSRGSMRSPSLARSLPRSLPYTHTLYSYGGGGGGGGSGIHFSSRSDKKI